MAIALPSNTRSRAIAAAAAITLQALLGWILITGLSGRLVKTLVEDIKVFDVPVVPPTRVPPPVTAKHISRRPSGAAAPPHARATPTPVVAPVPEIKLPPPPPLVIAAAVSALGPDAATGAAEAGEGTGAGGQGNGRGAGTGAGGTPARLIRGRITDRDYPPEARRGRIEGNLTTRYVVDQHGRITRCYVTEASGSDLLDAATCRLAIERFRYAPARDAAGRPVEDTIYEDHAWVMAPDAPGA